MSSASRCSTSHRSTYDAAAAAAWQRYLRLDSPQPMPGGDPPRDERGWGGDSNSEPEPSSVSLIDPNVTLLIPLVRRTSDII